MTRTTRKGYAMNSEERTQLTRFLQVLGQAQAGPKDPEAEGLIRDAWSRQPDAAYLLVQRVLQLEHEVQAAQKSSFVGDANTWGRAPVAAPPPVATQQSPTQQSSTPQTPAPASPWGSGMLGNVAGAAAGVVAGSLLMRGIGGLMGRDSDAGHAITSPMLGSGGVGGAFFDTANAKVSQDEEVDGGYVEDDFDTDTDTDDGADNNDFA